MLTRRAATTAAADKRAAGHIHSQSISNGFSAELLQTALPMGDKTKASDVHARRRPGAVPATHCGIRPVRVRPLFRLDVGIRGRTSLCHRPAHHFGPSEITAPQSSLILI